MAQNFEAKVVLNAYNPIKCSYRLHQITKCIL